MKGERVVKGDRVNRIRLKNSKSKSKSKIKMKSLPYFECNFNTIFLVPWQCGTLQRDAFENGIRM